MHKRNSIMESTSLINQLFDIHGNLNALGDTARKDASFSCAGKTGRFVKLAADRAKANSDGFV